MNVRWVHIVLKVQTLPHSVPAAPTSTLHVILTYQLVYNVPLVITALVPATHTQQVTLLNINLSVQVCVCNGSAPVVVTNLLSMCLLGFVHKQ